MGNALTQAGTSLAALLNLVAMAVLLWMAIGITTEITSRNADFATTDGYQKWLLGCKKDPASDKACPTDANQPTLSQRVEWASNQMRQYNSLNSMGALDRCAIAAVIASPVGGFSEDCMKVMSAAPAALDPAAHTPIEIAKALGLQNESLLQVFKEILTPGALSYSGWLALDQRAKEPLYFALVLIASAIGSLIAGLRVAGFTTVRDIALGLGAGFVVYILVRSGNFVFLTGDAAHVDILNPFTTGAVGFLVGLFKDRAFGLLDGVVRVPANPASGQDPAAKAAATAALATARTALEQATAKVKANAPDGPQALSDALAAFKQAEEQVGKA
jgi:hypothetical protein